MSDEGSLIAPTFYGATRRGVARLRLKGKTLTTSNALVAKQLEYTSGGPPSIDLSAYDAFVVCGLYFGRYRVLKQFGNHRIFPSLGTTKYKHLMSEGAFEAAANNAIRHSLTIDLVRKIRQVTDKPLVVCEQPMPREDVLARGDVVWKDAPVFFPRCDALWSEMTKLEAENLGFAVLDQPIETINPELMLTKREFGVGSVRMLPGFNEEHTDEDCGHMNSRYGQVVLQQVISALN